MTSTYEGSAARAAKKASPTTRGQREARGIATLAAWMAEERESVKVPIRHVSKSHSVPIKVIPNRL